MEEELEEANANATSLFTQNKNLILEREGLIKAQDKINFSHDTELKETTTKFNGIIEEEKKKLETANKIILSSITVKSDWSKILEAIITKLTNKVNI